MLNLEKKTIDYLKLDVEGSEMEIFKDIFLNSPYLLNHIKQIGIEIHIGKYLGKLITKLNKILHKSNNEKIFTFSDFSLKYILLDFY